MSIKSVALLSTVALAVGAVSLLNLADAAKNFNSSKSNTSLAVALPGGGSARTTFSYDLNVKLDQEKPPSREQRAAIVDEICAQVKKDLFGRR